MFIARRHILVGAAAATVFPATALAATSPRRDFFGWIIGTKGILPQNPADVKLLPQVLNEIPTTDYVAAMKALAGLDKNPRVPKGSTNEPWNRRWRQYANPLLVHIWNEMGYTLKNDCTAWCGVTLGWCLKRCGITPPNDPASSQSYLGWGDTVPLTMPKPGDICVFTDKGDAAHGHVTIFEKDLPAQKSVFVIGANQELSIPTNCPGNLGVNVVDERAMARVTPHHRLNQIRRPRS